MSAATQPIAAANSLRAGSLAFAVRRNAQGEQLEIVDVTVNAGTGSVRLDSLSVVTPQTISINSVDARIRPKNLEI